MIEILHMFKTLRSLSIHSRQPRFLTTAQSRLRTKATRHHRYSLSTMASEPATKKQKTTPEYTLLYHGGIPGRGEYIRLAFEAAQVPFSDPANDSSKKDGSKEVYALLGDKATHETCFENPPPFAPPYLKVKGEGKNGGDLLIYQTPNILLYLGPKLGLAGEDEVDALHVNELALTALDMSNEAHDTHHPVAVMDYYEDQKDESLRKATDFRKNRMPKFFEYFARVLEGNQEGGGKYLVGSKLTYADLVIWHVLDGLYFAFPNEMKARKKEFSGLLEKFYAGVKEEPGIKNYLDSGRRMEFSMGLFRKYPELDRE